MSVLLALSALTSIASADTVLLPVGATWKYLDNGTDQSAAGWDELSFDDVG